ncbi:hypothetical protein CMK11_00550 [Candidatus Poribacteria bacterium]|nr:hypothetical protein [Candidatus Poribacteria bacterium]
MGQVAQGLWQGITFVLVLGVLGFPFFVWRRRPAYHWRCPQCQHRNPLDARACGSCEQRILEDDVPKYIQADWTGPDLLALYLTSALLGLAVAAIMLIGSGSIPQSDITRAQAQELAQRPDILWTFFLLMGAFLTVLTVWMLASRFRWSLGSLGLRRENLGLHVLIGAAAGVVVALFGGAIGVVASSVSWVTVDSLGVLDLFPIEMMDPLWVLILPAALIVGPVSGELFFRGMAYRLLRARWPMPAAVIASALLFALGSSVVAPFAALVALGAANGVLFERTRSLVPGVVASSAHGALVVGWALARTAWATA